MNTNKIAMIIAKWNVVTVNDMLEESNTKLGDKAAEDNMNKPYETGMKSKNKSPFSTSSYFCLSFKMILKPALEI